MRAVEVALAGLAQQAPHRLAEVAGTLHEQQGLAAAQTIVGSHQAGGLRHQADGFAVVGFGGHVLTVRIVQGEHGDRRTQDIHGVGMGHSAQEFQDRRRHTASGYQVSLELIELSLFGQSPVPEEEDDFLESGVVRQYVNVEAAVAEDATGPIDVTNLGLACDDAFQTCRDRFHTLRSPPRVLF